MRWIFERSACEWFAAAFIGGSCIEGAVSHRDGCQGLVGGAGKYGELRVHVDVDGGRRWQ